MKTGSDFRAARNLKRPRAREIEKARKKRGWWGREFDIQLVFLATFNIFLQPGIA